MARYYAHMCEVCEELKTMKLIGRDEMNILECETCGVKHDRAVAPVPKKKTTWPYYHEGTGMRFESESHEQKYAKHHKLEKV